MINGQKAVIFPALLVTTLNHAVTDGRGNALVTVRVPRGLDGEYLLVYGRGAEAIDGDVQLPAQAFVVANGQSSCEF